MWQQESSSSSQSTRKRRKSKAVSEPEPRVLASDSDLSLLIKARKDGGIVHEIQPLFVPQIIARCGMRWWNAQFNKEITNVLREIVVQNNMGRFGEVYDKLREAKPGSEHAVIRALRTSHQHTAKEHHFRMAMLIAKLFRHTADPAVNYVKSKVFGIENGAPILGNDHPLVMELMARPVAGAHVIAGPFLTIS